MELAFDAEIEAIPNRGLTRDTAERFNYQVGTWRFQDKDTGEWRSSRAHFAPFYDETGRLVAWKVRYKDQGEKKFAWTGEPKAAGLFGQNVSRDSGKMIVVTEGEIDALSVSQAQGNKWPVVSVPNGAHNAKKDLAKHVDWLEGFEKIILAFDNDDAGRQAVEDCALLFTPGKVYDCRLPLKDANEMIKAGRSKELVDAIWGAKAYRPDGIRSVADLREEARKPVEWGLAWPFETLTHATYGIRRGEVYTFGAGVGVGKTELFKDIIDKTVSDGRPAGVLFLEENAAHTLKVLAGKRVNRVFHIPDVPYDQADLDDAIDQLDGKVFIYDHFGAKDYDDIKARIRFMVQGLGVKDVFLDHLTALVAGVDDERRSLDFIMADLAGLAQQLDFTLYLISHLTTPDGKPHEEGGRVFERHFTGSRAIARWSHFMFALERNKQDTDGVTTFRILKDRYTGRSTGLTFGLRYDLEKGRLEEAPLPDGPFKDESPDL
jgi:twinkle protein